MKTLIFGIAAFALLVTASCNKTEGSTSSNSWTLGSNTFSAATVTAKPSSFNYWLIAKDGNTSNPHIIIFSFAGDMTGPNATPPPAGTYKVVNSEPATVGQVSFTVYGSSPANIYLSTGNDNVSATIFRDGDKMRISMPEAWAANGGDSMQVSADIIQN